MTAPNQVHLLVITHGLWGNPAHVASVAKMIRENHAELAAAQGIDLEVVVPETNRDLFTYDGIDWCAERVVKETLARKEHIEADGSRRVTRLSMFGYSLGGLMARYAVGILQAQGFFQTVEPVNFCTFATPHIGILGDGSFWRRFLEFMGTKLLSRTGKQFFAQDKWSPDGKPLLAVLADKDRLFHKALSSFKHIHIYANGVQDVTVPFYTGFITTNDPFLNWKERGLQVTFEEKYAPILKSYTLPDTPPPPPLPKTWFEKLSPPRLPPFIKGRFSRGFVYIFFPVLVPLVISMVIVRFALATHSSQRRIRLMEKDTVGDTRLVHMLRELEQEVGEAVADMVEQQGDRDPEALASVLESKGQRSRSDVKVSVHHAETLEPLVPSTPERRRGEAIFTPLHRRMVADLNSIPHMKKHIAFIPEFRNSHATIIVRDPDQFDFHEIGRGVIRHWIDGFEF
ncbi:putative serine esterase-domain-containing protein [Auriculariales sp. MPI-PUGE-AT-0066]|nr:putative serine esterase-domain-containing protein [Auriculariales sp. MPI-PUGE-AT-0066]